MYIRELSAAELDQVFGGSSFWGDLAAAAAAAASQALQAVENTLSGGGNV